MHGNRRTLQTDRADLRVANNLAFAGAKDGLRDELAEIAESGISPVCIPRDAVQSSTMTVVSHVWFTCRSIMSA